MSDLKCLCNLFKVCSFKILLIGFRERGRDRENISLLFHMQGGWMLYVHWLGTEHTKLAHWDDALTHWATHQGLYKLYFLFIDECCDQYSLSYVAILKTNLKTLV